MSQGTCYPHFASRLDPSVLTAGSDLSQEWRQRLMAAVVPTEGSADPEGSKGPVDVLISPQTQAELAQVMTECYQQRWPIMTCGSGSKLSWGSPVEGAKVAVSTQALNQLVDHAAADLTVTVGTGMRLLDLQMILAEAGQWWPVDPLYPDQATVGGIIATADTGSLRHRYGGIRDHVLGVTMVRSDGQVAKAGGRVVKNVAGYDLMKLMTGSYGTLGILAEVTLRLYPLPATKQMVWVQGSAAPIRDLTRRILASSLTPVALDLLAGDALPQVEAWRVGSDEASGSSGSGSSGSGSSGSGSSGSQDLALVLEFHGLAESLQIQVQQVMDLAEARGMSGSVISEVDACQQKIRSSFEAREDVNSTGLAKLGVLPSEAVTRIEFIRDHVPGSVIQIHAGNGLGRWRFPLQALPPDRLGMIRSELEAQAGLLSILEAPQSWKAQVNVWGYRSKGVDLMKRIKQQFDHAYLLSPGRFKPQS